MCLFFGDVIVTKPNSLLLPISIFHRVGDEDQTTDKAIMSAFLIAKSHINNGLTTWTLRQAMKNSKYWCLRCLLGDFFLKWIVPKIYNTKNTNYYKIIIIFIEFDQTYNNWICLQTWLSTRLCELSARPPNSLAR